MSILTENIGPWPYRLALAGGWIDQPRFNKLNSAPSGAMVTVRIEPDRHFMRRAGLGTSTRETANLMFPTGYSYESEARTVEMLYETENESNGEFPSGSQDAAGIVYQNINMLTYGQNEIYPSVTNESRANRVAWLESILWLLPINQRPPGYSPFDGPVNYDPLVVQQLGQSGQECFEAIQNMDIVALGASFSKTMTNWLGLFPQMFSHPDLQDDLLDILADYASEYPGAMYSGCGGGYLYILSHSSVPGASKIRIV